MRTTSHPPRLRVALVIFGATATFLAAPAGVLTQGQPTPAAPSRTQNVFRATTNFVSVDVVVRDRSGNVVKGLKADDFLVSEEGKAQQVLSFDFEEVSTEKLPANTPTSPVLGLEQLQNAANRTVPPLTSSAAQAMKAQPATTPQESRFLVPRP